MNKSKIVTAALLTVAVVALAAFAISAVASYTPEKFTITAKIIAVDKETVSGSVLISFDNGETLYFEEIKRAVFDYYLYKVVEITYEKSSFAKYLLTIKEVS